MAYHVLRLCIKKLGYCCPHAYFTAVINVPTGDIAKELGIHKRTARYWRAAFRDGKVLCQSNRLCYRSAPDPQFPDQSGQTSLPRIDHVPLLILPFDET